MKKCIYYGKMNRITANGMYGRLSELSKVEESAWKDINNDSILDSSNEEIVLRRMNDDI